MTVETPPPVGTGPKQPETLSDAVTHVVEEARMLIPGVTAFLGFQLIAVFNQGFTKLTHDEQMAHVWSVFLTLLALFLLLAPAAYHRQAESGWATQGFITLSSRLITSATPIFAVGLAIDFYLLVRLASDDRAIATVFAVAILIVAATLWYAVPHVKPLARLLRGDR